MASQSDAVTRFINTKKSKYKGEKEANLMHSRHRWHYPVTFITALSVSSASP
jgi:hypothetical protein